MTELFGFGASKEVVTPELKKVATEIHRITNTAVNAPKLAGMTVFGSAKNVSAHATITTLKSTIGGKADHDIHPAAVWGFAHDKHKIIAKLSGGCGLVCWIDEDKNGRIPKGQHVAAEVRFSVIHGGSKFSPALIARALKEAGIPAI